MRLPTSLLVLSLLLVAGCGSAGEAPKAGAELLSGPYVIALATDGATVCWQTVKKSPGAVRFKAQGAAEWTELKESAAVQFHAVGLAGLSAGAEHQVEVLAGPGGRKLGELSFRTAPKEAEAFTFYVYGDTRSHPDAHAQVVKALGAEAARLKQYTFMLNTGDLAGSGSDEKATAEQFFVPAAPLLARLPFVPMRGNHECGTDLFDKYFPAPERPKASGKADDLCFDYGSVRVIVLDQYTPPADRQGRIKWVADRLAEAKDRWRIVAFHEPIYSTGSHGSNLGFRELVEPALLAGRVHLVVAGHDHNYERTKPIGGITHVTAGGGGAPLRGQGFGGGVDWSVKFEATIHFLTVAVTADKLTLKAFRPGAKEGEFEVFDTVEIPKACAWPGAKPKEEPQAPEAPAKKAA